MSDREETYNGWTNRETWAANLWITNDQGMAEMGRAWAEADVWGDALKDWIEELANEQLDGGPEYREVRLMLSDIGSLWRVNWKEIRDALLED